MKRWWYLARCLQYPWETMGMAMVSRVKCCECSLDDWWLVTGDWWLVTGDWWLVTGDCIYYCRIQATISQFQATSRPPTPVQFSNMPSTWWGREQCSVICVYCAVCSVCEEESVQCVVSADIVLQPPKSGFNTVRLEQVQTHCFSRHAHGATLGRIFFSFEAQNLRNSEKSEGVDWKNLPMGGPLGN